jgi:hypothetical protein
MKNHAQRQAKLNRQIRIARLSATCRSAWRRPPAKRVFTDPNRHVTALSQTPIILGPVRKSMLLSGDCITTVGVKLMRHLQCPGWNSPQPCQLGTDPCNNATPDDVGDPTALPSLLHQIAGQVDLFLADGAYDGEPTCVALPERCDSAIKIVIPASENAVLSPDAAQNPRIRDHHIVDIAAHGRMAWQKASD